MCVSYISSQSMVRRSTLNSTQFHAMGGSRIGHMEVWLDSYVINTQATWTYSNTFSVGNPKARQMEAQIAASGDHSKHAHGRFDAVKALGRPSYRPKARIL